MDLHLKALEIIFTLHFPVFLGILFLPSHLVSGLVDTLVTRARPSADR